MFTESSYGKATFPQSQGKVVTVTINKNVMSQASCPFWQMGLDADAAVQQQLGIDTSKYTHRSYYIPRNAPGCYWGGVAYIGCSTTHCKSWIRDANGPVLAHEIGHNLGLQHAGLDSDNDGAHDGGLTGEYGDHSGIMGNSALWRGVNAPHRIGLGWMPSQSVLQVSSSCASKQSVTLTALQRSPGTYSVIKIPRAKGGDYFVSLRTKLGYDATMSTEFANMVSIQYETTTAKASSYIKGLANGQSFSDGGNLNIKVISMDSTSAVVSLCGGGDSGGGPPPSPTPAPPQGCTNDHGSCNDWQQAGYCTNAAYRGYMETTCRVACNLCGGGGPPPPPPPTPAPPSPAGCANKHSSCASWKASGYCSASSQYYKYMTTTCPSSCDVCNGGGGGGPNPTPSPPTPGPSGCSDGHSKCSLWKTEGYCSTSSTYYDYVSGTCPAACGTCGGPNPTPSPPTPAPPTPAPGGGNGNGDCDDGGDNHASCATWAEKGYCSPSSGYSDYVIKTCPTSCNACGSATTTRAPITTASAKQESVAIVSVAPTLLQLSNPTMKVTVTYSTNSAGAKVNIIVEKPGSSLNIAQLATGTVLLETEETKTSGTVSYDLDVNVAGVTHNQPLYVRAEVSKGGSKLSQSAIVTITTAGSGGMCQDEHGSCGYWGGEGHCSMSSEYYEFMRHRCKMTCRLCATQSPIGNPPTATTTIDPAQLLTTGPTSTTTTKTKTPEPTAPPLARVSAKSCDFFGWSTRFKNQYVCAESDEGMGGCQKKKPWFAAGKTWKGAGSYCEGFGARLCTRSELDNDVARGTGCGYDNPKNPAQMLQIWTSDKCIDKNGDDGQWIVGGSWKIRKVLDPVCGVLEGKGALKNVANLRCCADVFEDTSPKVSMLVSGVESLVSSPSRMPPVEHIYPDNYGDVDSDESEFPMPPIPPPTLSPSSSPTPSVEGDGGGGGGDADTSSGGDATDAKGTTNLEETTATADKSTAAVTATVIAAVAFVLMLVVIIVVVSVRRTRMKEATAAGKHADIEADIGSRSVTTVKGSALAVQFRNALKGDSAEQRTRSQVDLANESRTSEYETTPASPLSPQSPFSEPGFMLDAGGSVRLESTRRANPLCPDPFVAAGIHPAGVEALNARHSPACIGSAVPLHHASMNLRRESANSVTSIASVENNPFC